MRAPRARAYLLSSLGHEGLIVPIMQLGADVVPVVKLAHDASLRFRSTASQLS